MTSLVDKISGTVSHIGQSIKSAGKNTYNAISKMDCSAIFNKTKEGISQVGEVLAHPIDSWNVIRPTVQGTFIRIAYPFLDLTEEEKARFETIENIEECLELMKSDPMEHFIQNIPPGFFQYVKEAILRNDIDTIIKLCTAYLSPGILAGIITKSPYEIMRFLATSQEIWGDILCNITFPKVAVIAMISVLAQRCLIHPVYTNFCKWQDGYWMNGILRSIGGEDLYEKMPPLILEDPRILEIYKNTWIKGRPIRFQRDAPKERIDENPIKPNGYCLLYPANQGQDPILGSIALSPVILVKEKPTGKFPSIDQGISIDGVIYDAFVILCALLENSKSPWTGEVICQFPEDWIGTEKELMEEKIRRIMPHICPLNDLRETTLNKIQEIACDKILLRNILDAAKATIQEI